MMNTVAEQILQQFAANFASQVSALAGQRAATGGAAAGSGGAPASAAPVPAAQVRELNVLAMAWSIFQNWLRRLFARKVA
jgi:hypothetical protein